MMPMVEIKFGQRTVDSRYTIWLYGVTDEMFDELVEEEMKAELIRRVMIVHSPASLRDDNVAGFLRTLMRFYAADKGLGLVLGPGSLIRLKNGVCRACPDLFFLTKDRVPNPLPDEYEGVPDLVLELLHLSKYDVVMREKREFYRQVGVKEIWFVDPWKKQIIIDRLRGRYHVTVTKSSGRVESAVIEGFWIEVAWLWSDPLPNEMQCLRHILG
jgi:Uma2 family endonuclease